MSNLKLEMIKGTLINIIMIIITCTFTEMFQYRTTTPTLYYQHRHSSRLRSTGEYVDMLPASLQIKHLGILDHENCVEIGEDYVDIV